MQGTHWLLDAVKEMEIYAEENGLTGMIEGLGSVLEIYAAEAVANREDEASIVERLKK